MPLRSVRAHRLDPAIFTPDDPATELIAVGYPTSATWFFDIDKNLRYPEPKFDAAVAHSPGHVKLTITARSLLRDVLIAADRLDAESTISDQLVTLLPGESFTFDISTERKLTESQLTTRPVFQCVNRFGRH